MIDEVLEIIKEELETFFKLKMKDTREKYVQLAPIVDQDGKPSLNENAICMTLVKIEEDKNNMSNGGDTELIDDEVHFYNPPVKLNLYILFSATYMDGQEKNYKETLKRLSHVIAFFQAKNVFTSKNTPKLDPQYGEIVLELYNQPIEEQNHLWGMLGSLYRPSVLYQLRALMVREKQIIEIKPPTKAIEVELDQQEPGNNQ